MAKTSQNIPGFKHMKSSDGIHEYELETNGLRVLIMEDHSSPVATFMVTYLVGSRNEVTGNTGATHLLEHLMFKGSTNFNKEKGNAIWQTLENTGAQVNATTWNDRTNYYALLPVEHLAIAMAIEADRMRGAFIREEDRASEMPVVMGEFRWRTENDPSAALYKHIWSAAYQAHPYHHDTIGWRSDIEQVPIERLREFYNTFYWPNNAVATLIGDIGVSEGLMLVKKHFEHIPRSTHEIPEMYTQEPVQEGPRRIVLRRHGEADIVGVAHKRPAGLHDDTSALQLLASILFSGKTSRFHRTLIDAGVATNVDVFAHLLRDNGLLIGLATLIPGTPHEIVEKIILDEYEKVKADGVTQAEVDRAKAMIMADMAFSRDGVLNVAEALTETIAIGDWRMYTTLGEKVAAVSVGDIKRVAQIYLNEDQSTTGWFVAKKTS